MEKQEESKTKSAETKMEPEDLDDYCSDDPSTHDHDYCEDFHCWCC